MTTVKRVERALVRAGLRHVCNGIEQTRDGEVVMWCGGRGGVAVKTVTEALRLARRLDDDEE